MDKPYLTKFAYGRWWCYRHTKHKYWFVHKFLFWHVYIVSYKRVSD